MIFQKKIKVEYLIIFFAFLSYLIAFYFKEYSPSGSKEDFYGFVFRNIQIFKNDFFYALKNYGKLGDANYPFFYIFHAYFNPLSSSPASYLFSTFVIGLLTFAVFFLCFKNLKFTNLNALLLSSLILYLPWFSGRAYWGTASNLAWFFFVSSIYYFIKISQEKKIINNLNLYSLLFCITSSITLYVKPIFIFFPIFYLLNNFYEKYSFKTQLLNVFFYIFLAIPGIFLIIFWGGIYDHSNSNVVQEYHTFKNIFKNSIIISTYFFFYLWPIFLIYFFKTESSVVFKEFILRAIYCLLFLIFLSFLNLLDYLNYYTYGGGFFVKLSYLFNDKNNFLVLLAASLGFSFLFIIIKDNIKKNLSLLLLTFFFFGFPKNLFQDYFEPLILFLFFLKILDTRLFDIIRKKTLSVSIIYSLFFASYHFLLIVIRN